MSIIGSELLFGAADEGGYQIERSLRFNRADSANLSRTPSVAGNIFKYTLSFWVKFGDSLSVTLGIIEATSATRQAYFRINNGNLSWQFTDNLGRNDLFILRLGGYNSLLRDTCAWYHIVTSIDLTQASASNVCKFYINGKQFESYYLQAGTNYVQSTGSAYNEAALHTIGRYGVSYFAGYLTEFYSIDGQILNSSDFGEFDTNGIWQPVEYTGSYGTNGFYLNFSDNSTASALGTDGSGNGNNWAVNNISVAAGAGNDSLIDSPTSYGVDTGSGGQVRGNYATFNSLVLVANRTLSNGDLDVSIGASNDFRVATSTVITNSGKYYCEVSNFVGSGSFGQLGLIAGDLTSELNQDRIQDKANVQAKGFILFEPDVNNYRIDGNSGVSYTIGGFTTGDVLGFAWDVDSETCQLYKNGSALGSVSYATSNMSGKPVCFVVNDRTRSGPGSVSVNFGQRPFAYTAPSGYKALCTTNLPDPTIAEGRTVMEPILYTGNSSTQTISGMAFSPDLVWIKTRNVVDNNVLFDTIRGATWRLFTNSTFGSVQNTSMLTSFNSDGFTLGSDSGVNGSGRNLVAWSWDAGSSTVSNTNGSITSSVRANPSAGFSIVSYTGNSTSGATVGHGLNAAPQFIFLKNIDDTWDWVLGHNRANSGTNDWNYYFTMPTASARVSSSIAWNNTAPTSTVFTLGNWSAVNYQRIIAYCFAPIEGYSSFGSARGNGSTNGSFVYLGFRPSFLIWKQANGSSDWYVFDSERIGANIENFQLQMNSSADENTTDILDFYSNGFKLRTNDSTLNGATNDYIYIAFAENPFKYARGR